MGLFNYYVTLLLADFDPLHSTHLHRYEPKMLRANRPGGETTMGRIDHGANRPWGESPSLFLVLGAKRLGRNVQGAKRLETGSDRRRVHTKRYESTKQFG